ATDPVRRFQFAADALFMLNALGDPTDDTPLPAAEREPSVIVEPHTVDASVLEWDTDVLVGGVRDRMFSGIDEERSVLCERRLPPMPRDWRTRAAASLSMRLVGAGLGLYGLRAIPIVDREAERDALWSALHEARANEDCRV